MSADSATLAGQAALVTGASSGIGRAAALRLAGAGAALALVGRNREALERTREAALAQGVAAHVITADLAEPQACEQVVECAVQACGRLDVLVNAAGVIAGGTIETTTPKQWRRMMQVTLDSVFLLTRAAVPHLRATRGRVVNVSSVTGLRSFPGVLAYCVAKAGVDQLTRCAALELAEAGIRVNAVNPGVVVTELHRRGGMSEQEYRAFLERSKQTHPLGRVGTPEEVAAAILFLASRDSDWITGETLSVDGGRHLTCAR